MTTKADMEAFERFISGMKCEHGTPIGVECKSCEREMMLDFVVCNLEDGLIEADEVAQCIREGIFTIADLERRLNLKRRSAS